MTRILLLLLLSTNYCFAQSQLEMNQESYEKYEKADKELNAVYARILKDYKADTKFILKLKEAQRAWIRFRDAEMNAIFPADDKRMEYGSVFPMCWNLTMAELTMERVKKLKLWTEGLKEGEVCAGSMVQ